MRILTFLILVTLISISACEQKRIDLKKAHAFYDSLNDEIGYHQDQQIFIDKMTKALIAVKEDPNIIIDTKELLDLFEKAKANNILKQNNIEKLVEVDENINCKKKTLDYFNTFNITYQHEFPKTIQIFQGHSIFRFEKAKNLLYPKLELIKEKEIEMTNSRDEFKAKYEALGVKFKRTGNDFEYVSLNEYKFSFANIEDGTKIWLLSFSGDKMNTEDKIFYGQFIGINKSNGDTIRILAEASFQQYDVNKPLKNATFKNYLPDTTKLKMKNNAFVIFNKNDKLIEHGDYKTAFGILFFEK